MSSSHVLVRKKTPSLIKGIFLINVLLAFHVYLPVYINSTFLSQFFDNALIDGFYTISAIILLIVLIKSAHIIKKVGIYRLMLAIIGLEIIVLFGLAMTNNLALIKLFFITHLILPPLLIFMLDICLESLMRTEAVTGRVRSTYLTLGNITLVVSPLLVGKVLTIASYKAIYLISALICMFLFLIVYEVVGKIKIHATYDMSFFHDLKSFVAHRDLRTIFGINFLLQCFYAIMVIYMPLYLHTNIGFSWETIGLLFTIMLLPFIIFEVPLGRMFDKIGGVKDTLIIGFLLIVAVLSCMFFYHPQSFVIWALLLFLSRVGASFIEIGCEYSFFKRVNDRHTGYISIYRMTFPTAYIVAPLCAALMHSFYPIEYLFITVATALLLGVIFSYRLHER